MRSDWYRSDVSGRLLLLVNVSANARWDMGYPKKSVWTASADGYCHGTYSSRREAIEALKLRPVSGGDE